MPYFMTIGYGDREGYDRTAEAVRTAAHKHDAILRKEGALMGIAGTPVQVRNADAAQLRRRSVLSCLRNCRWLALQSLKRPASQRQSLRYRRRPVLLRMES